MQLKNDFLVRKIEKMRQRRYSERSELNQNLTLTRFTFNQILSSVRGQTVTSHFYGHFKIKQNLITRSRMKIF